MGQKKQQIFCCIYEFHHDSMQNNFFVAWGKTSELNDIATRYAPLSSLIQYYFSEWSIFFYWVFELQLQHKNSSFFDIKTKQDIFVKTSQ
jgi:hypothetical protein